MSPEQKTPVEQASYNAVRLMKVLSDHKNFPCPMVNELMKNAKACLDGYDWFSMEAEEDPLIVYPEVRTHKTERKSILIIPSSYSEIFRTQVEISFDDSLKVKEFIHAFTGTVFNFVKQNAIILNEMGINQIGSKIIDTGELTEKIPDTGGLRTEHLKEELDMASDIQNALEITFLNFPPQKMVELLRDGELVDSN